MKDFSNRRYSYRFVTSLVTGLSLLTKTERPMAALLAASIVVNSLLQTAILVGVVPVIEAMIGSSSAVSGRTLAVLRELTGIADDETNLLVFSGLLAGLVLLRTVFGWLQIGWLSNFSRSCEVRMSTMVMRQVVDSPYEWHLTQNAERVREVLFGHAVQWSRDFVRTCIQIGNDLTFILFLVAVLIYKSPATGIGAAVVTALIGGAMFAVVRPRILKMAQSKRDALIRAHVVCNETIRGIKDVKMGGAEDWHVRAFREQLLIYSGSEARMQNWRQTPRLVLELVAYLALIGMSCAVVVSGGRGSDIASVLVLYALAALRILPMVNTLVTSFGNLLSSFPIVVELEKLARTSAASAAAAPTRPDTVRHWNWSRIDLDGAGYVYPFNDLPALSSVSTTIERGKSYGIVGPSGGGKSTLVDLVAGLVAPTSGSLSVDGTRIATDQDRLEWRRCFGYVSQRPFLLDASLRDNIVFGYDDGRDAARLSRAIELACLKQLVERLVGGLDGPVGDQGANLSGGERQRVAIARALYRGAEILVLDEATSALDSLVERDIADSIKSLRASVTPIVVSHRLGLVRACDEIWVIENGAIAAKGEHDALMTDSRLYARMIAAQDYSAERA